MNNARYSGGSIANRHNRKPRPILTPAAPLPLDSQTRTEADYGKTEVYSSGAFAGVDLLVA